jgi:hypothetical protein
MMVKSVVFRTLSDAVFTSDRRIRFVAKKTIVEIIDDIDGEPIESGGETIRFAVNGTEYSIDLNGKNATEFHRKMNYYIKHGERIGGRRRGSSPKPASKAEAGGTNIREIRAWARANGHDVASKGRIPEDIVAAYSAAH